MHSAPLLPALCLFAGVAADNSRQFYLNKTTYSNSYKNPPNDINENQWPGVMSNVSWEGKFAIDGYDISKEYPSKSMDDWSITVSTKDGFYGEKMGYNGSRPYFNAATLRLNPPKNLVKDALKEKGGVFKPHESWSIQASLINLLSQDNRTTIKQDDGSCSKLLNSTCVKAIEDAAAESFASSGNADFEKAFEDGCEFDYTATTLPIALSYENWGDSLNEKDAKFVDWYKGSEIQLAASEGHDSLSNDISNDGVSGSWDMVLVIWGYDDKAVSEAGKKTAPQAKLLCTRNQNVNYQEKKKNDAKRTRVSFSAIVIGVVAALVLA